MCVCSYVRVCVCNYSEEVCSFTLCLTSWLAAGWLLAGTVEKEDKWSCFAVAIKKL